MQWLLNTNLTNRKKSDIIYRVYENLFFILHLLSFVFFDGSEQEKSPPISVEMWANRREVPCRVKFRLARCDNLIIKELIQYANQTQPIVSALLCIMG